MLNFDMWVVCGAGAFGFLGIYNLMVIGALAKWHGLNEKGVELLFARMSFPMNILFRGYAPFVNGDKEEIAYVTYAMTIGFTAITAAGVLWFIAEILPNLSTVYDLLFVIELLYLLIAPFTVRYKEAKTAKE